MSAKSIFNASILLSGLFLTQGTGAGTWYVSASVSSSGDGTSWNTAYKTIQEGIDAASDGDTVTVAQGTYFENIIFRGQNIILRSTDPLDPDIVSSTIIEGTQARPVVLLNGAENETCVLEGFTIQNGSANGIVGKRSYATIQNNVITGNSTHIDGGGLVMCRGTIQNNVITSNSAHQYGGGLSHCQGTIQNNVITDNVAMWDGGGLCSCDGVIQDNIISRNQAPRKGSDDGGFENCQGTIQNNTITENLASFGAGLSFCNGTIQHNTISRNTAEFGGGGLDGCNGTIRNNTISGNSVNAVEGGGKWGAFGGGLANCYGPIVNNIITDNSAQGEGQWGGYGGGLAWCHGPIISNLIARNSAHGPGWSLGGGGLYACDESIKNNTIYGNSADGGGGGLRRCRGTIQNCIIWANTAIEGAQLNDSSVPTYCCIQDWSGGGIGNVNADPLLVAPGKGRYGLGANSPYIDRGRNEDWMRDATDLDGKPRILLGRLSMTVDMGAYEYGSFAFRVMDVANSVGGEARLTWASRPGDTYTIWCCMDPSLGNWIEETTIPSQGELTTWTDPAATCPYKLYRIELK